MATNGELQVDCWHDTTYGQVDIPATYRKLLEEIGELGEALMKRNPNEIHEEIGDCVFILRHILRAECGAGQSLTHAMMMALDKNERRRHAAELTTKSTT